MQPRFMPLARSAAKPPRLPLPDHGRLAPADGQPVRLRQARWYPDLPQGQKIAQAEKRPMMLYFWDWLSRDRARVELGVFNQPQVIAALRRTVNVRLEVGWFRDLARQYDVRQLPTFILTDPEGVEIARLTGVPTPQDFAAWLDQALRHRGTTQPAATRPATTQPPATRP